MAKADQAFVAATPLEERVLAGDYEGTLALLESMPVAGRARHRASTRRMADLMRESRWRSPGDGGALWPMRATDAQERAGHAALLLCGTADDFAGTWAGAEDVLPLLGRFEIPALAGLGEAMLERSPRKFRDVQALVAAGAIARPASDAYVLGLIDLPQASRHDPATVRALLAADPGLLAVIPRMFEVEGNADVSLASTDKYNFDGGRWSDHLLALCAQGKLERAWLLDWTLGALARDWPQYRSGWFKGFHEILAPTSAERTLHATRYLQLCHSRIPPTVTLALEAVAALEADGVLAPDALLDALAPVLATGNKSQVEAALKILERIARDAALAPAAARLAATALVHDASALQAKLLKTLEKWPRDDAARAELRRHVPGIAASHRAKLLALIGEEGQASPAPVVAVPVATTARPLPLDPARALAPVAHLDELVQLVAHVFENDGDTDAFERALGALVAAAPIAEADRARFGPVRKRVAKLKSPLACELGRVLAFVLDATRLPAIDARDPDGERPPMRSALSARTDALLEFAAQGKRLVPLSTPTHRRGFIAPAALVQRQRELVDARAIAASSEQALALLRLAPGATPADLAAARALPDSPFVRALRYAFGDGLAPGPERAIWHAAARIRHPRADDAALLARFGDLGPDAALAARFRWFFRARGEADDTWLEFVVDAGVRGEDVADLAAPMRHPPGFDPDQDNFWRQPLAGSNAALVAWTATWLPSDPEAFFAEGARALGNNLDWWQAEWQNRAYLEPLLDPAVEAGEMARLALACGLYGKEPGQAALAVDVFVQMHADGRLDAEAFAAILCRLASSTATRPARLRRSFDAALRLEPALAPTCVVLLASVVCVDEADPRKDLATLLELLHELLAAGTPAPGPELRQAIARTAFTGTAKSLQKKVLALTGP